MLGEVDCDDDVASEDDADTDEDVETELDVDTLKKHYITRSVC